MIRHLCRFCRIVPLLYMIKNYSGSYGDVAPIYDTLMRDVSHAAWLHRIQQELMRRDKFPHSVLDVACGTGIVSELLYGAGYRPVVGIDLSEAMIRIAQTKAMARGYDIRYETQNAATLDLREMRFDFAVSLFDSLNYILVPADLAQAFVRIAAHLNPGGVLAFDVNSMYALSHDLFTQRQDTGAVQHLWKSFWDRETRTCRVEMAFTVTEERTGETRSFHETHVQRAYTITELREFLTAAGFEKIAVFGNYGERAPGPKSDRLLFIAEVSPA